VFLEGKDSSLTWRAYAVSQQESQNQEKRIIIQTNPTYPLTAQPADWGMIAVVLDKQAETLWVTSLLPRYKNETFIAKICD
jgi:hypothetical protein